MEKSHSTTLMRITSPSQESVRGMQIVDRRQNDIRSAMKRRGENGKEANKTTHGTKSSCCSMKADSGRTKVRHRHKKRRKKVSKSSNHKISSSTSRPSSLVKRNTKTAITVSSPGGIGKEPLRNHLCGSLSSSYHNGSNHTAGKSSSERGVQRTASGQSRFNVMKALRINNRNLSSSLSARRSSFVQVSSHQVITKDQEFAKEVELREEVTMESDYQSSISTPIVKSVLRLSHSDSDSFIVTKAKPIFTTSSSNNESMSSSSSSVSAPVRSSSLAWRDESRQSTMKQASPQESSMRKFVTQKSSAAWKRSFSSSDSTEWNKRVREAHLKEVLGDLRSQPSLPTVTRQKSGFTPSPKVKFGVPDICSISSTQPTQSLEHYQSMMKLNYRSDSEERNIHDELERWCSDEPNKRCSQGGFCNFKARKMDRWVFVDHRFWSN
eukprot:GHVH01002210.1.p2 GENE.GHVH01002210.1~~GHVH01002210.1.p2  ORF type:complete len:438 (-),score=59.03 GHVH01002210.1:1662-2975(-)